MSYGDIVSSTDMNKIESIFDTFEKVIFGVITAFLAIEYFGIYLGEIFGYSVETTLMLCSIILGLLNALSILGYNKRTIIRLTQPPTTLIGMKNTIKTVLSNIFDLLLNPMILIAVLFHMAPRFGLSVSLFSIGSTIFVIIALVQYSPLRFKKNVFVALSHQTISKELDRITISRVMRKGMDRRTKEYKAYVDKQISAEESIRVNSEFLKLSSGPKVMIMSTIQFFTPIAGTVAPMIVKVLF